MAKFTFGKTVDIHWNGYEIVGPALTEFSIPDQLYEEFEGDFRDIEPSLTWIDTNEFATLSASVSASTLTATAPIAVTSTSTGRNISFSSGTAANGYLLSADGSGGTIWNPASTSGLTSVVGVSPISSSVSGGVVSVSLAANYQTAGTYVTSVIGTSPISATGTTAITVSIDQSVLSTADAATASTLRTYVKNSSGSTITKGQVVYVTGADGTNALIGLSSASTEATSSKTLGIAANTMTNNAFGYVIENGQLSNIDTSAATAGSSVWLGNTPGSYVFNAPPAEPSHSVYLGVVTKANPSTGEILVKVQNGYEIDELHDVFVGGVSTALPLVYSSTSSGWIAQSLTSVGIADNAVVGSKIIDGAVTSGKIADGSVTSAKIVAGAVNSSILADNAVVAAKIAAGSVGSAALATGAVVAASIAAGAVGSAAIAAGAVNTSAINSGSATSGQILQATGTLGKAIFATVPTGATVSISEFTASGTWTKPAGASVVYVFAVAGGGGGASGRRSTSSTAAIGGGGGGGGGHAEKIIMASELSSSVTVTVGAGGSGGAGAVSTAAAAGNVGTIGGNTYFNGSTFGLVSAFGGTLGDNPSTFSEYMGITRGSPIYLNNDDNKNSPSSTVGWDDFYHTRGDTLSSGANRNVGSLYYAAPGGAGGNANSTSGNSGARGAYGFGRQVTLEGTYAIGDGATPSVIGCSGAGATGAFGLTVGQAGNAGNPGYRGGGGGGGGAVHGASGVSITSGAGGAGGGGYVLVVAW